MPARPTSRRRVLALGICLVALAGCGGSDRAPVQALGTTTDVGRYRVEVIAELPHDRQAFTQGLVWASGGVLFESTGKRGQSSLRRVEIDTGDVTQQHDLDDQYFGEGLALVDDRLIQLTWQEETAFVYDRDTFDVVDTLEYDGEGWGLCYHGKRLVMSDGSSSLTFRDPDTFEVLDQVHVTRRGAPLESLNELECVGARVYANVLGDDTLYEIDPVTGDVTAEIDASALNPGHRPAVDPLNGIAYAADSGHFYLTGKDWPTMYEVTFVPVD